jgi:hypothetical protein
MEKASKAGFSSLMMPSNFAKAAGQVMRAHLSSDG